MKYKYKNFKGIINKLEKCIKIYRTVIYQKSSKYKIFLMHLRQLETNLSKKNKIGEVKSKDQEGKFKN